MNSFRLFLVGLAAAVCGFVLQGCFDKQPEPECQVTAGNVIAGVSNYKMILTELSHTGNSCPTMKAMEVGLERLYAADGGDFSIGVRPARLVDISMGVNTPLIDTDLGNDCSKPDKSTQCQFCQEFAIPPPPNVCKITAESVKRVDPTDPKGNKLTGIAHFPTFPTSSICAVADLTITAHFRQEFLSLPDGGVSPYFAQHFPQQYATLVDAGSSPDFPLSDGGAVQVPPLDVSLAFTNFGVIMSSIVPGTAFTADLTYTEGTDCTATYKAVGIWPIVSCSADTDCDPAPDYDAGRITGSGMNPSFQPVCDTDRGFCVPGPGVDVTTLK
jgi:hypothetical protein